MSTIARLLRLARNAAPAPADTELLRRYATDRDEAAFAELVRRNGPLVLRACRHVLGEAAADDAFQATFLLLARSSGRLTRAGSLAGWLHAAAVRVAHNARRGEGRRRRREAARPTEPAAPDDMTWREVREVLGTEIAALPECDRLPVVLCCVQELSHEEAARRAGCPVGTLRGRLERGKARLRQRLARRGLPLAAPTLVAGCPPPVSAAAIEAVVGAVRSGVGGAVPPALAGLLRPTGRLHAALLLRPAVAALVAAGVVLAAWGSHTADPARVDPPRPAKPPAGPVTQPPADRLGDPLPAGAVARLGTRRLFGAFKPRWAAFSPDGTKVATQGHFTLTVCDAATGRQLVERERYWAAGDALGWRADGTGVAVVRLLDQSHFVSVFSDPDERLPLPLGNWNPGVGFLALSPDATRLAVVNTPDGKEFTIDILPATPGRRESELGPPLRTLGPFAGPCREVRYTARGLLFLTGVPDREGDWTLSIVDPDTNAVARTVTIPHPAYTMWGFMYSLSADARLAAVPPRPKTDEAGKSTTGRSTANRHDGTVRVWDLEAGKELRSIPFPGGRDGMGVRHAFTPDGRKLITSGEDPYFQVWDVATGREVARAPRRAAPYHDWNASAVAVSPDGKRFGTARQDGRIDVWDTATARPLVPLDTHRKEVTAVAVSPDGRLAATLGDDAAVRVWELATGKPVCTIAAPAAEPNRRTRPRPQSRPAFTPDGRGVVFTSGQELALADPLTGKRLDLPGALRGCRDLVGGFSADGKTLATFAGDAVVLRDWPAGTARLTVPVKRAGEVGVEYSAALSPDGRFLFTGSVGMAKDLDPSRKGLDVWDARTGGHLHRLEMPGARSPPAGFSRDGRVLCLGGTGTEAPGRGQSLADALTAWDPAAGTLRRRFAGPGHPGGTSGGLTPSTPVRSVRVLAVAPDGRLVAAAEPGEALEEAKGVRVYEAASGRVLRTFAGHARYVNDLAFSTDGRRLVSVGDDQVGLVWDVSLPALAGGRVGRPTGKELADAWERLAGAAPEPGYLGIATLVADPTDAVGLLKEKLRPAPVPTAADLDRVATQLAADAFAEREKASAELERFGPNAVSGAKARLTGELPQDVRDRLTRFLSRYDGPIPSPYELRCVRGVAALEAIGSPDAKALLAELAKGKPDDVLTREASAALRRVENR